MLRSHRSAFLLSLASLACSEAAGLSKDVLARGLATFTRRPRSARPQSVTLSPSVLSSVPREKKTRSSPSLIKRREPLTGSASSPSLSPFPRVTGGANNALQGPPFSPSLLAQLSSSPHTAPLQRLLLALQRGRFAASYRFPRSQSIAEHVNARTGREGLTALHCAAQRGLAKNILLLIQRGADVNRRSRPLDNAQGVSALHKAIVSRRDAAVLALLRAGADVLSERHADKSLCEIAADYLGKEALDAMHAAAERQWQRQRQHRERQRETAAMDFPSSSSRERRAAENSLPMHEELFKSFGKSATGTIVNTMINSAINSEKTVLDEQIRDNNNNNNNNNSSNNNTTNDHKIETSTNLSTCSSSRLNDNKNSIGSSTKAPDHALYSPSYLLLQQDLRQCIVAVARHPDVIAVVKEAKNSRAKEKKLLSQTQTLTQSQSQTLTQTLTLTRTETQTPVAREYGESADIQGDRSPSNKSEGEEHTKSVAFAPHSTVSFAGFVLSKRIVSAHEFVFSLAPLSVAERVAAAASSAPFAEHWKRNTLSAPDLYRYEPSLLAFLSARYAWRQTSPADTADSNNTTNDYHENKSSSGAYAVELFVDAKRLMLNKRLAKITVGNVLHVQGEVLSVSDGIATTSLLRGKGNPPIADTLHDVRINVTTFGLRAVPNK